MNVRMKFVFRAILLFPVLTIWLSSRGQSTDSSHLRISLITCGPGDELYSIWGHTAIRVTDSTSGTDVAFNYGTFDISDPYFYARFTRGLMRYALGVDSFGAFLQEYKQDHRSVVEQSLTLTGEQKVRLFALLKENALQANRYYNYRFCEDNCTTRAKAIINKCADRSIVFKNILPGKAPTYRELFHISLDGLHRDWSGFGIDLLLGSNLDRKITNDQSMFLPDYLMRGFDSAMAQGRPLVGEKVVLLEGPGAGRERSLFTPVCVFSLLALVFIFLSFGQSGKTRTLGVGGGRSGVVRTLLRVADAIFFFALGLLGAVMLFVWFGRVDDVCRNNLNVVWAWPTHLVIAVLPRRKHRWVKAYFRLAALVAFLLLVGWPWLPQQFNIAVAPLLVIIMLRSYLIGSIPD